MKVNKMQAIYKFLPGAWATEKFKEKNNTHYSVRIVDWNTKEVTNVYKIKLINEMKRNIKSFENRNGDVREFFNLVDNDSYELLEAAMNEGYPDIGAVIDPTLFYCPQCHSAKMINTAELNYFGTCHKCKVKMKQLQFVYACECGYAEGITLPYVNKDYYYAPDPTGKRGSSTYKFYYKDGNSKKEIEMYKMCSCGKRLTVKNAEDRAIFHPFEIKTVNLIDKNMGEFLKYDSANKILIANWLNILSDDSFEKILKNPTVSLNDEQDDDNEIKKLMQMFNTTYDMAKTAYYSINKDKIEGSINDILLKVDTNLENCSDENVDLIATELTEYYTLRNNKNIITLEETKEKSKIVDSILNEKEIDDINKKAKIYNAIVSHDIEIVNAAYGYTRIVTDPANTSEMYKNLGNKLKLKAFLDKGKYKVYTSLLNTEGILFEIDRVKIFEWLLENEIIDDDINLNDENEVKSWFLNNIDTKEIDTFSEIEYINKKQKITKCVYGLIHTISHLLMRSAGVYSGLNKDSISELIFPSVTSIYLYSTTIQGITMGSLSGMFEENYKAFISSAISDYEMCMFDPICMERQNGSCVACTILNETSCAHFNKDLSRAYLFGGEINIDEKTKIVIKKGFWK